MELSALKSVEFADVVCGSDHVLALTTDGCVYIWGNSQQGQLGRRVTPRHPINGLEPERLGIRNIVTIGASAYNSYVVDKNGKVFVWGLNTFKQCGLRGPMANEDIISTPTEIKSLSPAQNNGARVIQITGGEHHSLFLFDDGSVWGCGRTDGAELGICEDHPAHEGLKARKEEIRVEKQAVVDACAAANDKIQNDPAASKEEKEASAYELAGAEASLRAPSNQYVPEPIRVSCSSSRLVPMLTPDLLPREPQAVRRCPRARRLHRGRRQPYRPDLVRPPLQRRRLALRLGLHLGPRPWL